jgi:hypothetical protein
MKNLFIILLLVFFCFDAFTQSNETTCYNGQEMSIQNAIDHINDKITYQNNIDKLDYSNNLVTVKTIDLNDDKRLTGQFHYSNTKVVNYKNKQGDDVAVVVDKSGIKYYTVKSKNCLSRYVDYLGKGILQISFESKLIDMKGIDKYFTPGEKLENYVDLNIVNAKKPEIEENEGVRCAPLLINGEIYIETKTPKSESICSANLLCVRIKNYNIKDKRISLSSKEMTINCPCDELEITKKLTPNYQQCLEYHLKKSIDNEIFNGIKKNIGVSSVQQQ